MAYTPEESSNLAALGEEVSRNLEEVNQQCAEAVGRANAANLQAEEIIDSVRDSLINTKVGLIQG